MGHMELRNSVSCVLLYIYIVDLFVHCVFTSFITVKFIINLHVCVCLCAYIDRHREIYTLPQHRAAHTHTGLHLLVTVDQHITACRHKGTCPSLSAPCSRYTSPGQFEHGLREGACAPATVRPSKLALGREKHLGSQKAIDPPTVAWRGPCWPHPLNELVSRWPRAWLMR